MCFPSQYSEYAQLLQMNLLLQTVRNDLILAQVVCLET